jgi:ABC-type antimicrobial peptide transport system permease subunit
MSFWRYIATSLRQYWRIQLTVAAGVAVATAVITGALLVGDSMRGSLRGLVLKSLGSIDTMLVAEQPFREALADEWLGGGSTRDFPAAAPLILSQGSAVFREPSGDVRRASQLQIVGTSPEFWWLDYAQPGEAPLGLEEGVALTEVIAQELNVKVGDFLLLRLPTVGSVPADSTLGEKEETSASRRLKVTQILGGDTFPVRFSLRPSQIAPRNVFVPLATLQDLLELEGRVNAVSVAGRLQPAGEAVKNRLRPQLADFGLKVELFEADGSKPALLRISADRLVLSPYVANLAKKLYGKDGLQPVVTYLANRIEAGARSIPYSTVAGVDSTALLGPVIDEHAQPIELAEDEVALNAWAAKQLAVESGDTVTITWYEPETTHGELREAKPLTLKVRAILPLTNGDGSPMAAADPTFAPDLPGVTDQASIDDWDLPFELVEEVRDADEKYWDDYRTTPKAFVSHDLAARLWQTRWGTESVLRLPVAGSSAAEAVAKELRDAIDPAELGMTLLPVKENALAAASGTTPFDGLFLGFSFFLMASAVMLTALLFRLGIEQRAREVGLLLAVGTPLRKLRRLLVVEAGIVAAIGALVGVAGGVAYARLMVYGLNTWWVDATAAPFMELHLTGRSLVIGFVAGLLVALVTIAWSLRRFSRLPARQLLGGDAQPPLRAGRAGVWSRTLLPGAFTLLALALGFAATRLQGEAQAGAFFGGGALVLIGALLAIRGKLRDTADRRPNSLSLAGLAGRNARRNPGRTMLSLALSATASFLIVALSAFRLAPTNRGVGGFDLLGSADLPVLFNLGTPEGRRELGFTEEDSQRLGKAETVALRVHEGEDASCLNLYKPTQPRVLGAPAELAKQSQFQWAGVTTGSPPQEADIRPNDANSGSGWPSLSSNLGDDRNGRPTVPVILDRNTAAYSLKIGLGDRMPIRDGANREVTIEVVALLANSVLQGDVIMSEANFLRLYPEEAGRRFFLIRTGNDISIQDAATLLETQLEDFGFDAIDARRRLGDLMAVQNTYLSTFQSLGALGLLLGVVGLAVVQLRGVLERRGELALMQAAGFRRQRLAWMVLAENLVLLLGGLGIGCLTALTAVLPHAISEQAGTPWATLALLLGIVAVAGAAAAWAASRMVLRAPLLPALRGE